MGEFGTVVTSVMLFFFRPFCKSCNADIKGE